MRFLKSIALAFALSHLQAHAGALASIYNGEQYQLEGYNLVQDSDHPTDFYIMPKAYVVKYKTEWDAQAGQFKPVYAFTHQILQKGAASFGVYTITLELDLPSDLQVRKAAVLLRQKAGIGARIKGLAPVCGMILEMQGRPVQPTEPGPDATYIKYSLNSTEPGQCGSILDPDDLKVEIRVPENEDAKWAENFASGGAVLPAIRLIHPYKYKDHVSLHIKREEVMEALKGGIGLEGGYAWLSGSTRANIADAMNRLTLTGAVKVDCQDKEGCEKYRETVIKILEDIFIKYSALPEKPDQSPLIVADKDKAASSSMFRSDMAYDQKNSKGDATIDLNLENTVYSTIQSQVKIDVSGIPPEALVVSGK